VTSILFFAFLSALIRHCSLPLVPQTTPHYCTSDSASAFEFAGTEQNNTRNLKEKEKNRSQAESTTKKNQRNTTRKKKSTIRNTHS